MLSQLELLPGPNEQGLPKSALACRFAWQGLRQADACCHLRAASVREIAQASATTPTPEALVSQGQVTRSSFLVLLYRESLLDTQV